METNRLETFSGGVIAIISTIMVLELIRPWIAGCIYILVALMWFIPDRRLSEA